MGGFLVDLLFRELTKNLLSLALSYLVQAAITIYQTVQFINRNYCLQIWRLEIGDESASMVGEGPLLGCRLLHPHSGRS